MKPIFSMGFGERVHIHEMEFDGCTHVRIEPANERQLEKLHLLERVLEAKDIMSLHQLKEIKELVLKLTR